MPTDAALKRSRTRKFKAKASCSFGSTSSHPTNLPSRMKADLPDLFARLEVQRNGEEGVHRSDDSEDRTKGAASNRCSNDEIVPTAEKAVSEMRTYESSPHSTKPMDGYEWEDRPNKSATDASQFNREGDLITSEEAESHALTGSDAADIARLLRKVLKKNGQSLEKELLSALSPSQVQHVIYAYRTLAAFMDHRPEFEQAQDGQYILAYYEDLDGEGSDCSGSSHTQDEASLGRYSNSSSDGGRQHADDREPERERCSSSSSSCLESAMEEQSEEKHVLKDASCQVPLSPPCYSKGLQAVQETSDADAQTKELDTSRFVELQSTLQSREADVRELKERLENVQQSQVSEVQQLCLKIELLAKPQAATPQYVVRMRNRIATREQKPIGKNRADDEARPPQPRPPLRQRNLPPRLRPENRLPTHLVETKPRPLTQGDKQYSSKRKFVVRAKPSSDSTNSGFGYLPSRVEVNLPELFAHPEMHTRSDDPAGTTEEAASALGSNDEIQANLERTLSRKFEAELTSHSIPTVEESEREDSARPFVEDATILNAKEDATVVEKSHPRALTESDVADIENKLRRMLQVHGPSDQGELLKALRPSQAQDVLQLYGTLTAFIEQLPGFILLRKDLYTFVYYEEPDGEEYDCGGSSNLQDDADDVARSTASGNGGHQYTVSDDCERQRARSSSSSSSCYESAVEEHHEEENNGIKIASCQVSSSPRCHSRGLQAVPHTSDAEAQTEEFGPSRFVELRSTPQGGGADVTQMKERLENLRQNQVGEVQQLRTEQLLRRPQAATPQYVVKLKNRTETEEQKPVDKNRAGDEVNTPQPRLPLRQRNLPPRPRPENKLLMPPVEPRPWPLE
ncbi:hypothetical protein HPB52_010848 [Rhipicephalus sanguineus]|uniref:Uncharacterized protein n=1 Tax=Rhipicephalus sanguineus TaxID=34632 RepID=A0A9D4Q0C6_RHISA|nr:hypothetical protein HPB52_010848 [Rhipicephalus sanguineus]